jgi:hypothetical protein
MIKQHSDHIKFEKDNKYFSVIINDRELFDYIDDIVTELYLVDLELFYKIENKKHIIYCDAKYSNDVLKIITTCKIDEIERIYMLNNKNLPNKRMHRTS